MKTTGLLLAHTTRKTTMSITTALCCLVPLSFFIASTTTLKLQIGGGVLVLVFVASRVHVLGDLCSCLTLNT